MEEKKRPTRTRPKTSDNGESSKDVKSSNTQRVLRKRRVDLNGLAKDPLVCQFQYCGIQLTDFETLEVMQNVNDMTSKLVGNCRNLFTTFLQNFRESNVLMK